MLDSSQQFVDGISFFSISFLFTFYKCIVPMGFLPWEIRGTFIGESQLRQRRATQPTVQAGCLSFFRNPPNSNMGYGIFNMLSDVNACDCNRGLTDTVRESALKVDSGRKIPRRTGESNLRRRRADPILYQLSYIPTPLSRNCIFFSLSTYDSGQNLPFGKTSSARSTRILNMLLLCWT